MSTNGSYIPEYEILRIAERERAKVIADFFRSLFGSRKETGVPAHVVPAE